MAECRHPIRSENISRDEIICPLREARISSGGVVSATASARGDTPGAFLASGLR
jgi:hypothetical protein